MKGMRVRLLVDFMVLSVMLMSALCDVLTSMLLISSLLLGYMLNLETFQRIVVCSLSVSLLTASC